MDIFAIALVMLIHVAIATVEMFFWQTPAIYERLDFTTEIAAKVAPIVQNAGLYNAFIALGLLWSLFAKENRLALRLFFLGCVVVAGVFGAFTLRPTTLILQTVPALIALLLTAVPLKKLQPKY